MNFPKYEDLPYGLQQKFNKKLYDEFVSLFKKYNLRYIPADRGVEYVSPDEMGVRQETNLSYIDGLPEDLTNQREQEIQQAVAILFYKDGLNTLATNEDLQNAVEALQNIPRYQEEYHTKQAIEKTNQETLDREKKERDLKVDAELTKFDIPTTEDFRSAYIDLMGIINATRSSPTRENLERKIESFFDIYGNYFIEQPEVLESFIKIFTEKSIYPEPVVRPIFKKAFEKVNNTFTHIQQVRQSIEHSQQTAADEAIRLAKDLKPKIEEFQEIVGAIVPEQDFISSENDPSIDVSANMDNDYSSIIRFSQNSEIGKLAKEISNQFKLIKDAAIKANKPWYSIIPSDTYKAIYDGFYGTLKNLERTVFSSYINTRGISLNPSPKFSVSPLITKSETPKKKYFTPELKQKVQQQSAIKVGKFPKKY